MSHNRNYSGGFVHFCFKDSWKLFHETHQAAVPSNFKAFNISAKANNWATLQSLNVWNSYRPVILEGLSSSWLVHDIIKPPYALLSSAENWPKKDFLQTL